MELKLISHEWHFQVDIDLDEAPPVGKTYTQMRFQPTQANLTIVAGTGEPRLSRLTLAGPRINKSGYGDRIVDTYHTTPEWLQPEIDKAIALCTKELGLGVFA